MKGSEVVQEIYFYFDDSGVLHPSNDAGVFVYAGYVFLNKSDKECAKRKYKSLVKKIQLSLNTEDELKACKLKNSHKRALFNVMKTYETVSSIVKIKRIYEGILSNVKSICRYKDYILKLIVKEKLKDFIQCNKLDSAAKTRIYINVDEQLRSTSGVYNLETAIYEELKYGIVNYDYGKIHKPIFYGDVEVKVKYCESKHDYLIQASDILANRIFTSYRDEDVPLRELANHKRLIFP